MAGRSRKGLERWPVKAERAYVRVLAETWSVLRRRSVRAYRKGRKMLFKVAGKRMLDMGKWIESLVVSSLVVVKR